MDHGVRSDDPEPPPPPHDPDDPYPWTPHVFPVSQCANDTEEPDELFTSRWYVWHWRQHLGNSSPLVDGVVIPALWQVTRECLELRRRVGEMEAVVKGRADEDGMVMRGVLEYL
jgi:hypothetical protein